MLLINNNESQIAERKEYGRTCSQHHNRLFLRTFEGENLSNEFLLCSGLHGVESKESCPVMFLKALLQLCAYRYLRYHIQYIFTLL